MRSPTERPDGKNASRKFLFSFPGSRTSSTSEPSTPHCSTITAGSQDFVWGFPTSLQGQLGPVCVFSEGLQENQIKTLYLAGECFVLEWERKKLTQVATLMDYFSWLNVLQSWNIFLCWDKSLNQLTNIYIYFVFKRKFHFECVLQPNETRGISMALLMRGCGTTLRWHHKLLCNSKIAFKALSGQRENCKTWGFIIWSYCKLNCIFKWFFFAVGIVLEIL